MSTEPHEKATAGLPPVGAERTVGEHARRELLAAEIEKRVRAGARVDSQSDYQAVLVKGHRPSHLLHFFIGLLTLSAWWILVWFPICVFGGEKRRIISVAPDGTVSDQRA